MDLQDNIFQLNPKLTPWCIPEIVEVIYPGLLYDFEELESKCFFVI